MSTEAYICVFKDSHEALAIRVLSDGHPEHTGKLLKQHYSHKDEAKVLINLGSLRYLQDTLSKDAKQKIDRKGPITITNNRILDLLDYVDYVYYVGTAGNWYYADRELREWPKL